MAPSFSTQDLDDYQKTLIWYLTPDAPQLLNGTDEVRILCGDFAYGDFNNEGYRYTLRTSARFLAGGFVGLTAGALADKGVYAYRREVAAYDNVTGKRHEERAQNITRRGFLGTIGMIAGGFAFGRANSISSYADRGIVQDSANLLTELSAPLDARKIGDNDVFVDGRTALIAEKSLGINRDLSTDFSVGSLVMGNEHIPYSNICLRSDDARKERIESLARMQIAIVRQSFPFWYTDDVPSEDEIRTSLSSYFVVKIQEPDPERFRADYWREIERIVTLDAIGTSKVIEDILSAID